MKKPHSVAITNLIESIDWFDPTRAHESKPSVRMRRSAVARQRWAAFTVLLGIATVVVAIAAVPY